jgi:hypothetical protein
MVTLFYVNKRGAHTMRTFSTNASCWIFMQNLRTRAVAKRNGEVVGRISHRTDGYEDQPGTRKWFGWIEDDAPAEHLVKNYVPVQHADEVANLMWSQRLVSE